MGLFGHGGLFSKVLGGNAGKWLNNVTGVTESARQQYEYNKLLQEQAQEFNAEQAKIQRDWEAEQSNTAIQRRSADLQKAGINPVLAAGASADTGAGATATSPGASTSTGTPSANPISMLQSLVQTMNSAKKTDAEIREIDNTITNNTNETNAKVKNLNADTKGKTIENKGHEDTNTTKDTPGFFKFWNRISNNINKDLSARKVNQNQR